MKLKELRENTLNNHYLDEEEFKQDLFKVYNVEEDEYQSEQFFNELWLSYGSLGMNEVLNQWKENYYQMEEIVTEEDYIEEQELILKYTGALL